jgi:tetratricopeptide (TPR) repeat protein
MRSISSLRTLSTALALAAAALVGACGDDPKPRVSELPDAPPPIVQPKIDARSVDGGLPIAPVAVAPVKKPDPIVVPDSYAERVKLARKLADSGKLDDAEDVYEKAIEADRKQATPHIEIARLRLKQGDAIGARKHAEQGVKLAPESSYAWNTMGRVELMDADAEAAIDAFVKATDLDENNIYAWNNLGLALTQVGRFDEAATAIEHATDSDKAEPYMWHNLGLAYEHGDRLEEARVAYKMGAKKGSDGCKQELARLDGKTTGNTAKIDPTKPEAKPDSVNTPAPSPEPQTVTPEPGPAPSPAPQN